MNERKISRVAEPSSAQLQRKSIPAQHMLVFSTRRLLTEESSVTRHPFLFDEETETLAVRATTVTTIMTEIPGYRHCGINE